MPMFMWYSVLSLFVWQPKIVAAFWSSHTAILHTLSLCLSFSLLTFGELICCVCVLLVRRSESCVCDRSRERTTAAMLPIDCLWAARNFGATLRSRITVVTKMCACSRSLCVLSCAISYLTPWTLAYIYRLWSLSLPLATNPNITLRLTLFVVAAAAAAAQCCACQRMS